MLRFYDPDSVGAHWALHYAAAIRAVAGEQAHITKDQQVVFEDALTNSVKIITEKGCAAAGEEK